MRPLIIAELGSNPCPDWDFPVWCAAAKLAGADAVKVQLFRAEHFRRAGRISVDGIWYDISDDKEVETKRPLEFPRARFNEFVSIAHSFGLQAGASVFDDAAVKLVNYSNAEFIKLAAREQENRPLLCCALTGREKYIQIYRSISSREHFNLNYDRRTIHFATMQQYPASLLLAVSKLFSWAKFFKRYGVSWGWSSHTRHWLDCWVARTLGASVIEKHFALSTQDVEAGWSLMPRDFARMVRWTRR